MFESLHCHTKSSDGSLAHLQVLELAAKHNISVIAFTDHDALPDAKTVKQLQNLKNPKVNWIIGCELSCGYPPERGGGPSNSLHIVGLFIDPFNPALVEHNQQFQQARIERMKQTVKSLQDLGFKITADDCLKASGGESVGRPHIVEALLSRTSNKPILLQLADQMKQVAQNDSSVKQKYQEMINSERGFWGYPFYLFLSHDAFIPGVYVPYPNPTDMDTAVKLIRDAGGISILAHWTFEKEKLTQDLLGQLFQQDRLDGAEILYGMGADFKDFPYLPKDMQIVRNLTQKHHRLQSGGADLHTAKHIEEFSKYPTANQTIGLTQKLLKDPRVNPTWSSFTKF
jgi:predicted metal-dependent phosphoesterase TrpH